MIKLSPQQNKNLPALEVSKLGDVYTINRVDYDFAQLQDGDTLPAEAVDCEYLRGDVERVGQELNFTLLAPYIGDGTPEQRFPDPVENIKDGVLL